jgi:2-polyprenyl-6-hydroxyphenyl methylase/3-demethylubiquinone-9 3-methyltransferase
MPARDYHEAVWETLPRGTEPEHLRLRSEFLLSRVGSGQRVLDVGCGEGQLTALLAAVGADVLGVDVADQPLQRAREQHPGLQFVLIDGEGDWLLPDAAFDVVWAGEVIEHVADTAAWLSEARRVLRPHGTLLLSTPAHGLLVRLRLALSAGAFDEHFDPRSDHLRFYTRASLHRLLADFGFEDVRVRAAGPWPARAVLLVSARRMRF